MDFDEYEYLENTMENSGRKNSGDGTDRGDDLVESQENGRAKSSKRKSDDEGDDLDRQSRRSRSRKEFGDYDKDRSLRHSSFSRDKEKGQRDRSSREHRHRDREEVGRKERGRDREDSQRERYSSRKRDGAAERKEHESDREKHRTEDQDMFKRSRSNSHREYDERGKEVVGHLENADADQKERPKEEYSNRGRDNRRKKDKNGDKEQPEADPERDQRTVFAFQISLKAGERDIYDFFSRAGKVRDVQLIMDRITRRSRGVGYVEFYDAMSVPMAIALSGQLLLGQPILVKPSEAEKNLAHSTAEKNLGTTAGEARKLYVGNLPVTIKEDHVRQVFEAFGTVEMVQMPIEPGTGSCKCYAFVQFSRVEDAKAAQNLNGQLAIAGRTIKVSAVTEQSGFPESGLKVSDLDDDEGAGWSLKDAQSRAILMQKLDRTGAASSITGSSILPVPGQISAPMFPGLAAADLAVPPLSGSSTGTVGMPSECLLLHNMFDPNVEAEPDFDLDIKEDVQEECSKFGKLKHIHVEKKSAGCVYLQFDNTEAATAAQRALHWRWFAGKMVIATFMTPSAYEAKFPDISR